MNIDKKNLELGVDILSSLANSDSVKIFFSCADGINSSTKTILELGITQKRYYTWLKRLIDSNLVEKRDNAYVQTMLGKFCSNLGFALFNAIEKRSQLELADKLMRAETFSIEEKEEILKKIAKDEIIEFASLRDIIHNVKMIEDYDFFEDETIKLIEKAKNNIYLATYRINLRFLDAIINAVEREVKFNFVYSDKAYFSGEKKALKMIINPSIIKSLQKIIDNLYINVKLSDKLLFSFCVIDDEKCIIDLPSDSHKDFLVAFEFKNKMFCKILIKKFNILFNEGNEFPLLKFVEKYSNI